MTLTAADPAIRASDPSGPDIVPLPIAVEAAPAKLNLWLHVTGRRADGYHELDGLTVFPPVVDVLRASNWAHQRPADESPGPWLTVDGPAAGALEGTDPAANLVVRAARLLAAELGRAADVRLLLTKRLPVAAGIGGGSADAAATLRALLRLWGAALPPDRLAALAAALGADVPLCLDDRPKLIAGIGDVAPRPVPPLPELALLLANPGVGLPTPAVFGAYAVQAGGVSLPAPALPAGGFADAAGFAAWLAAHTRNDLTEAAVGLCPSVAALAARLAALPGALLVRMSGSGATCFALLAAPLAFVPPLAPWQVQATLPAWQG